MPTIITFGATKDGNLERVYVDNPPQDAAGALNSRDFGVVQLQRDNEPFWVNAANVLYLQEVPEPSGEVHMVG